MVDPRMVFFSMDSGCQQDFEADVGPPTSTITAPATANVANTELVAQSGPEYYSIAEDEEEETYQEEDWGDGGAVVVWTSKWALP